LTKGGRQQVGDIEENPPLPPLEKGGSQFARPDSDRKRKFPPFEGGTQGGATTGIYFLKEPEGYFSNRWLTTILVNPEETGGITRENIRIELEKENIECRPLWKPMHMQPLYEDCEFYGNGVSEWLFEYGLCLPSGSNLTDEEREKVLKAIKNVLEKG
jgi:dTDP-4-amino-4,6-dideoxygalactose transaminase